MTKDNSTGKNKEFYDLGKKMFDRLNPTKEDEAFETIDKQQQQIELMSVAQREAQEFIVDHAEQLGVMTLRKAFEMGYRFGYSDAVMRSKNATHKP